MFLQTDTILAQFEHHQEDMRSDNINVASISILPSDDIIAQCVFWGYPNCLDEEKN